jgi:hypothetical protein
MDHDDDGDMTAEAEHRFWMEAQQAGWSPRRLELRNIGRREQNLPSHLPFDRTSNFSSSDPRFAAIDEISRRIIAKGRVPEVLDLTVIFERVIYDGLLRSQTRGMAALFAHLYSACGVSNVPAEEPTVFAIRRWSNTVAEAALESARDALICDPKTRAYIIHLKNHLKQLASDLQNFRDYLPSDIADYMRQSTETEKFPFPLAPCDTIEILPDSERELEASSARLQIAMACSALAQEAITELAESITEYPNPTREDVFTIAYIEEMRALWKVLLQEEPPRASSGLFVDFVAAGWEMNELPTYPASSGRARVRRGALKTANSDPAGWLGDRILQQARRANWVGLRPKMRS